MRIKAGGFAAMGAEAKRPVVLLGVGDPAKVNQRQALHPPLTGFFHFIDLPSVWHHKHLSRNRMGIDDYGSGWQPGKDGCAEFPKDGRSSANLFYLIHLDGGLRSGG